jgi:cellulose synthase/poly-beta-1,6-N-acetylglucosamine synthase-like glycosyltransferase
MHLIPNITFDFLGIVLLIFLGMVAMQLVYLFVFQLRLLCHKPVDLIRSELPSVSVVICARNEEDNLFKNLPIILEQNYPDFEVVIVNDQSQDDSIHIIKAYQKKYPFIKYIELEKNQHRQFGKKLPLTVGIKGAEKDFIIVTDADCLPKSKLWLQHMAKNFTHNKEIVLGYSPYIKTEGFLNQLIRFDTSAIAITYLSFAKTALTYMGVGRNMGYSKAKFEHVGGFKSHYHIASGDDDLFIKDAATRKNTGIELAPETFIYTEAKETWAKWISQKQRHFTTAGEYRLINKLFLGILPLSMFLMHISFFILLFNTKWYYFVLAVYGVRLLFYWVINGLLLKKLHVKDLAWRFPIFEIIHSIVMPFIFYSNSRTERKKW